MGIYVWGTGCGASELIGRGLAPEKISCFVDSFPCGEDFLGKPVILPEQLNADDCELLIVTTRHAEAVERRCGGLGIPKEKCLFLKNNCQILDRNRDCSCGESILSKELLQKLLPEQHIVPTPAQLGDGKLQEEDLQNDYVRMASLELLCRRVKELPGAVAELGVYRGFFARCINQLLPDRTLYLFDSFAGFRDRDGASEAFQAAHANTTAEKVLQIMPHPECIVLKPGFFPESLDGLEERFCLVSLDVDFESATLDGLRYFWPRLEKGGYLLLHDWGNPDLPGVAEALRRYEEERNLQICAVPLPDIGGTLVLSK